jgi:hypothetical protein
LLAALNSCAAGITVVTSTTDSVPAVGIVPDHTRVDLASLPAKRPSLWSKTRIWVN